MKKVGKGSHNLTGTAGSAQMPQSDHPCECGCGLMIKRRFAAGHNAKLRSRLLREARIRDQLLG